MFSSMSPLSRPAFVALLLFSLAWTGCDSSEDDDENGDAAILIGEWTATSVRASGIDVLDFLGLSISLTLEDNGTGTIVTEAAGGDRTEVDGTYSVDEQTKTITVSGDDLPGDLSMMYEIIDQDNVEVTLDADDLENLGFDLSFIGPFLSTISVELTRI